MDGSEAESFDVSRIVSNAGVFVRSRSLKGLISSIDAELRVR